MDMIHETLETRVADSADVLVVGGGIAGVAAAVAARRRGADVLLIEKSVLLGGLATNGLISWYEPLCDGHGTQLIYGLAEELLRLSIQLGPDTLPQIWQNRSVPIDKALVSGKKQNPVGGRYATFFSPTIFQLSLDELLEREGVRVRLDIRGVRPLMEGAKCLGVVAESISGREAFLARMVIDATGDAAVLARAGVPCVDGHNFLSMVAHRMDTAAVDNILSRRKWMTIGADLYGNGHPEGYPLFTGLDNAEETRFVRDGHRLLTDALRKDDRMKRDITTLPAQAQFRKTRRLAGGYTLTEEDSQKPNERSIALIGDFERPGDWYEVPYECLYHPAYENLLAVGRMISSSGWAWDVTRVIPCCAATGEAAGTAAALALKENASVNTLNLKNLQSALRENGMRLHRTEVN